MNHRSDAMWELVLASDKNWHGGGDRHCAVSFAPDGTPNGYALYELVDESAGDFLANSRANVHEFVANDIDAELALWDFICSVPFVRTVELFYAPQELLILHHLRDPRQLKQTVRHDQMWFRPIDVAQVLSQRRYLVDGVVHFGLLDPVFADLSTTITVEIVDGVAEVTLASSATPTVTVTSGQLGSLIFGEIPASSMGRAGLLDGSAMDWLHLDRCFAVDRPAFALTRF